MSFKCESAIKIFLDKQVLIFATQTGTVKNKNKIQKGASRNKGVSSNSDIVVRSTVKKIPIR